MRYVALVVAVAAIACGDTVERASFPIPGTRVSIVVERESMHPYLAEYHRTLILELPDHAMAVPMSDDTGGYSRTNLYRIDERAFLARDAEASYTVSLEPPGITKDLDRRREGTFVGAFDLDGGRRWRFVPSSERGEQPAEFRGKQ